MSRRGSHERGARTRSREVHVGHRDRLKLGRVPGG